MTQRVKCSECGLAPNLINLSGESLTFGPDAQIKHVVSHVMRDIDREILGMAKLPFPKIELVEEQ
jgi:hypothetical protein